MYRLSDERWDLLLGRIKSGKCTPFLGAGVNSRILPTARDIAKKLAKKFDYPLPDDPGDLLSVAEFLAITRDPMHPKEEVSRILKEELIEKQKNPDFSLPDAFDSPEKPLGILGVLADFPLPIYITTNYDNLMFKALESRGKKPKRELCRWNKFMKDMPSVFDKKSRFVPTADEPVVFHLHGHEMMPESMVLTEDCYVDFLVSIARNQNLIPPRIQQALFGTSLLFIGYRLADWDFHVIFRGLVRSIEASVCRDHVAVQLPKEKMSDHNHLKIQDYMGKYFGDKNIFVYWGEAQKFAKQLKSRWEAKLRGRKRVGDDI